MLLPPPHSPWIFTKGNRLSIFSPCGKEPFWSGKISSLLQNRLFFHGLMQVMLVFFFPVGPLLFSFTLYSSNCSELVWLSTPQLCN